LEGGIHEVGVGRRYGSCIHSSRRSVTQNIAAA
jgi:hypothetical protein